jgi:hypothetical protein
MYTVFFENVFSALSILINFSSNSFFLLYKAKLVAAIGILSKALLISFLLIYSSSKVSSLSYSPINLVPGGILASSSSLSL